MKKPKDMDDFEAFWFATAMSLLLVVAYLILICLE